ncbi:ABC-2 type transport system ATP-binding protein [Enterococcus sp. PF1-24]|uniref:ATP-binding cassette domain-containing protein n=1 Tax=unclassified Enterococcus TaxID=2608891 RepID=UPI00247413CB|nr:MULTISPECIES: ATP-binding cassette domain-containing protein [unclassified Enterococcus]MDH6363904.1 ABC-2 type transport system ATP-binding protein [Enterococcus sp. PFB1-1]MDH6400910.1 ABC-2 type transport system ATP-binding protein [Enterococcus sp. PF1-24]
MKSLLSLKDVSKKYKKQDALDHVTMTINQGDIYGFIGRNGAGKTTLLRTITGLNEKTAGTVEFTTEKIKVGAVIEGPACYPYLSSKDNLMTYCYQQKIANPKERVAEVLQFVGLGDVDSHKTFKDYSLGMKQRLGIAVAILSEPDFLILDEPINGLDPQGIVEIREIIQRLNQEQGTTILISSHILSELSLVATRYGIINQGKLIKELTQAELIAACSQSLLLDTSDNQTAVEVLNKAGMTLAYQGEKIKLMEEKAAMPAISAGLFAAGIYVTEFSVNEQQLEDYYLNLVRA